MTGLDFVLPLDALDLFIKIWAVVEILGLAETFVFLIYFQLSFVRTDFSFVSKDGVIG